MAFAPTWDPEAARRVYEGVLGLTLVAMTPIAVVLDANATTVRVTLVDELTPPRYTILGWEVRDVHATVGGPGLTRRRRRAVRGPGPGRRRRLDGPERHQVAWFMGPAGRTRSVTELARS